MTSPTSKESPKKSWIKWVVVAGLVILVGVAVLAADPCSPAAPTSTNPSP